MTMYLMLFRQGQAAVSASLTAISGMYEDNLYLSNLYEYLEQPVPQSTGHATTGLIPGDGVRFEHVSFTYPGNEAPALVDVNLHISPGQSLALVGQNGSGKTTLIKLLTRLYAPTEGRILLDGRDLQDWDEDVLRRRIGVIFQDFVRYQMLVGENIGAGDVQRFDEPAQWRDAAEKGMADSFIDTLPEGYDTQLGRWFQGGRELSGGQWQKIAMARALANPVRGQPPFRARLRPARKARERRRSGPTSSERNAAGRSQTRSRRAQLYAPLAGVYAHLFTLQARGYR